LVEVFFCAAAAVPVTACNRPALAAPPRKFRRPIRIHPPPQPRRIEGKPGSVFASNDAQPKMSERFRTSGWTRHAPFSKHNILIMPKGY
jgi:hypothetical protein